MSQGDLANELEVSRQSVSKWENNSVTPELDKLIKLSRVFDVTLDELVNGEPVRKETALSANPVMNLPPTRVLAGMALLATYKPSILGLCMLIHFAYTFICFTVVRVTDLESYLFIGFTSVVLVVWLLVWGLKCEREQKEEKGGEALVN